ncbi:MAG: hypothetical protein AB7S36_20810, partial [Planctomycetota bacterium]
SMLRPFQNAWELWQSAWQPPVEQRAVRDRQRLRDSRNRLIDVLLAHPAIALHALVGETADHLDVLNRLIDDDDAIAPPVAYVAAQEAYAFGVAMQLASVRDGFVRERCDLRMAAALWRELQELDRTGLPRLEDADRYAEWVAATTRGEPTSRRRRTRTSSAPAAQSCRNPGSGVSTDRRSRRA